MFDYRMLIWKSESMPADEPTLRRSVDLVDQRTGQRVAVVDGYQRQAAQRYAGPAGLARARSPRAPAADVQHLPVWFHSWTA
jgi:hypothetical protein